MAHTASMKESALELLSSVDPAYGIRVRRTVTLTNDDAFIETVYEKVEGSPVQVAVWTITQLASPDRIFALLPERTLFPGGHRAMLPAPPKDLVVDGRLLGLARDPKNKTMIASDADALLWVGPGRDLLIENVTSPRARSAAPGGAHAQIYTSPDDAEPYVELELLGPLVDLARGQSASMSVRYSLLRRQDADAAAEARRVFAGELGRTR
jgi:hypothetical protein